MKNIFFFLVLCLFARVAFADALLPQLEARYGKVKSWQADFTQTSFVAVLEQNISKDGKIAALRPDKIRIDYQSDPQKTYIVNAKKLWVIDPVGDNHSPTVQEFNDAHAMISPEALSFLNGLANITALFDVAKKAPQTPAALAVSDVSLEKINLVPRDAGSMIEALTLGVDAKTLTLKEAVLFNDSGNVTHYEFKNTVFDSALAESYFKKPK